VAALSLEVTEPLSISRTAKMLGLQQLCAVDNRIFYMADVNVFLLNILPDKYFKRVFLSG